MTRGTAPKKRNASTCARRKLGIAARSEKRMKRSRLYESTMTRTHRSRTARPTASLPKCPQSTCASWPGSTVRRRYASAEGRGRSRATMGRKALLLPV